jgi:hypothetical protein
MAHLHNFPKNQHPGWFEGIGNNIKFGAEIAGAVKTIFDVGGSIYSAVAPAAAVVAALA